ncbi:MAG: hypothetical protein M0004_07385 [Actinomycetota bacterium]|nr:hypothetical protein [Actinomycetota bacterium]
MDAHVVLTGARYGAAAVTSDIEDLRRLSDSLDAPIAIRGVHDSGQRHST